LTLGLPEFGAATGSFRRIMQTPGGISIFYDVGQGQGWQRNIIMDGRPHLPASIRQWYGDSRGHWEGNTLIVEGRNFNEHGWYDTYGNFHSSDLRIEERFTFAGNRLYYDVTSHDPRVFSQPWTAHVEFRKNTGSVDEPWETACFEGDRDTQHILPDKAPPK
jgi:hypothetical protein